MKIIVIIILSTFIMASDQYKEPQYKLLHSQNNIEIRQYDEYVVARTSISNNADENDNNMFRNLAGYIFGNNKSEKSIPMTAPVTTYDDGSDYHMIFYMLEANSIDDLPLPNGKNVELETMRLDKCAVLKFSWTTRESRVEKFKEELVKYLDDNDYETISPFMLNRYDPPWTLPFMRRNEIIVKIK